MTPTGRSLSRGMNPGEIRWIGKAQQIGRTNGETTHDRTGARGLSRRSAYRRPQRRQRQLTATVDRTGLVRLPAWRQPHIFHEHTGAYFAEDGTDPECWRPQLLRPAGNVPVPVRHRRGHRCPGRSTTLGRAIPRHRAPVSPGGPSAGDDAWRARQSRRPDHSLLDPPGSLAHLRPLRPAGVVTVERRNLVRLKASAITIGATIAARSRPAYAHRLRTTGSVLTRPSISPALVTSRCPPGRTTRSPARTR